MPKDFYRRVLDLEKEIEKHKEKCTEPLLKGLMSLYSEAIEYFGFIDQVDKCGELQMRMQSILVRPYVLECLNRFEREHMEEEAKQNGETLPNATKIISSNEAKRKKINESIKKNQKSGSKEDSGDDETAEESNSNSDSDSDDTNINNQSYYSGLSDDEQSESKKHKIVLLTEE